MSGKSIARRGSGHAGTGAALLVAGLSCLLGCESAFQSIDRRTKELLVETNEGLGQETSVPDPAWPRGEKPREERGANINSEDLATVNPASDRIVFTPAREGDDVLNRLLQYAERPSDALEMDLHDALEYAINHSREYRFAEEEFLLSALRLMSERHLWGPRLFNDFSAEVAAIGDNGLYDSSLAVVNDLYVTQRLPYGGEVSARLLAAATENLHRFVAGQNVQTAALIFEADVPLLRGAGMVAREDLIQSERNVVYAARAFERFRREFLFDITTDFLDLVVQQQSIVNSEQQVEMLQQFGERERSLADAGRVPPFEAALAVQSTLFAVDRLADQQEAYRLSLDRFKVRLGMPAAQDLIIRPTTPGLPRPAADPERAVRSAMSYRLDLQNRRDRIDDARRGVNIARNNLLADLDLSGSIVIPTNDNLDRAGLNFDTGDLTVRAAIALSLPLDREIERLGLRQAQVSLERSVRDYEQFRDTVAVNVRAAARNIDLAEFSRNLQAENVKTAELRLASIEAAPDRASARDRSEAADALLDARDVYLRALRDVQVSILGYLLASGQLRIGPDGSILPLQDMQLDYGDPSEPGLLPRGAE
jgi:outer membrane protein TolC